jgi:hypothetical protein
MMHLIPHHVFDEAYSHEHHGGINEQLSCMPAVRFRISFTAIRGCGSGQGGELLYADSTVGGPLCTTYPTQPAASCMNRVLFGANIAPHRIRMQMLLRG